jgi:hypothetical protein
MLARDSGMRALCGQTAADTVAFLNLRLVP